MSIDLLPRFPGQLGFILHISLGRVCRAQPTDQRRIPLWASAQLRRTHAPPLSCAARTKKHVCDILAAMLAAAKAAGNTERQRKILRAQKYLGCRNVRKRRSTP